MKQKLELYHECQKCNGKGFLSPGTLKLRADMCPECRGIGWKMTDDGHEVLNFLRTFDIVPELDY